MINTLGQYLTHCGSATVLIDEMDDVVFCSKGSKSIIARAETVATVNRKLSFNNLSENQKLISGIALAKYQRRKSTVFLDDEAFDLPLRVDIIPISYNQERAELASVLINLSTGDDRELHLSAAFREYYCLTAGEEKLADLLNRGLSISEIAEIRNIKKTTARWTLSKVFQKTKTNSQRELRQLARHFSDPNTVSS